MVFVEIDPGDGILGGFAKTGGTPGTMVAIGGRAAGLFPSDEGEAQGGTGSDGAGLAGSAMVGIEFLQFTR